MGKRKRNKSTKVVDLNEDFVIDSNKVVACPKSDACNRPAHHRGRCRNSAKEGINYKADDNSLDENEEPISCKKSAFCSNNHGHRGKCNSNLDPNKPEKPVFVRQSTNPLLMIKKKNTLIRSYSKSKKSTNDDDSDLDDTTSSLQLNSNNQNYVQVFDQCSLTKGCRYHNNHPGKCKVFVFDENKLSCVNARSLVCSKTPGCIKQIFHAGPCKLPDHLQSILNTTTDTKQDPNGVTIDSKYLESIEGKMLDSDGTSLQLSHIEKNNTSSAYRINGSGGTSTTATGPTSSSVTETQRNQNQLKASSKSNVNSLANSTQNRLNQSTNKDHSMLTKEENMNDHKNQLHLKRLKKLKDLNNLVWTPPSGAYPHWGRSSAPESCKLIPISLDITCDGHLLSDVFQWNIHENSKISYSKFSKLLVQELNLPQTFIKPIVTSIESQVVDYQNKDKRDDYMAKTNESGDDEPIFEEFLVPISVTIDVNGVILEDRFEYDIMNPINSPEKIAEQTCVDLVCNSQNNAVAIIVVKLKPCRLFTVMNSIFGLTGEFEMKLATVIRDKIVLYTQLLEKYKTVPGNLSNLTRMNRLELSQCIRSANEALEWQPEVLLP